MAPLHWHRHFLDPNGLAEEEIVFQEARWRVSKERV